MKFSYTLWDEYNRHCLQCHLCIDPCNSLQTHDRNRLVPRIVHSVYPRLRIDRFGISSGRVRHKYPYKDGHIVESPNMVRCNVVCHMAHCKALYTRSVDTSIHMAAYTDYMARNISCCIWHAHNYFHISVCMEDSSSCKHLYMCGHKVDVEGISLYMEDEVSFWNIPRTFLRQ